jgi:hypothetical protein
LLTVRAMWKAPEGKGNEVFRSREAKIYIYI